MYKIFCIGNSLTSDTTRFFTELAEHEEGYSKSVAMLIGGMTIDGHAQRLVSSAREHEIYINGINTRFKTSIGEAIASDKWDYIMLQQAYGQFGNDEEVRKYYEYFAHFFKMAAPESKVLILNAWSPYHPENKNGEKERTEKSKQYERGALFAAKVMGLDKSDIVPAGKVVEALMQKGVPDIYRDEVHLTLSLGRYAAAQTLYSFLSGKKAENIAFRGFNKPRTEEDLLFKEIYGTPFPEATEENISIVQKTVDEILGN